MQRVPQPVGLLLCFCAALLFPIASFGQLADDANASASAVPSYLTYNLNRISLVNTNPSSPASQPLEKFESSSVRPNLAPPPPPPPRKMKQPLPHLGIAFTFGTLGFGGQAATAILHRANVRVGFNYFNFNLPHFHKDGASYTGALNMRSFEAELDYYLIWGIHISPGALLYNGNKVTASASIPNGQTFTLGGQQYAAQGPITGAGTLPLNHTAPMLKIGFGNLLPRNHRHFTFNFDIGAVFQQAPKVGISLAGFACQGSSNTCATPVNMATDPTVQTNIASEEAKINKDLKFFRYYPIIATSIGWKF